MLRLRRALFWSLGLLLGCVLTMLLLSNAHLDSLFIHRAVADLRFELKPGASPAVRFPPGGPYDQRLGYAYMPSLIVRLKARHFEIVNQAVQSAALARVFLAGGAGVSLGTSPAALVFWGRFGRSLQA